MSYLNRVWDAQNGPGFVSWTSALPDTLGSRYPGPGTFGVDTSDYVAIPRRDDSRLITQPVKPGVVVPTGTLMAYWPFDESLADQGPNGFNWTGGGGVLTRYASSPVPGLRALHKSNAGGYTTAVGLTNTGAMTCELMFRPRNFMSTDAYLLVHGNTGAVGTSNTHWAIRLLTGTNEFQAFHEYAGGSPSIHFINTGYRVPPGQWSLLAWTRDSAGTFYRMYVNGVEVYRETVGNAPADGTNSRGILGEEPAFQVVRGDGDWGWARLTAGEFTPEQMLNIARDTLPPEVRP